MGAACMGALSRRSNLCRCVSKGCGRCGAAQYTTYPTSSSPQTRSSFRTSYKLLIFNSPLSLAPLLPGHLNINAMGSRHSSGGGAPLSNELFCCKGRKGPARAAGRQRGAGAGATGEERRRQLRMCLFEIRIAEASSWGAVRSRIKAAGEEGHWAVWYCICGSNQAFPHHLHALNTHLRHHLAPPLPLALLPA